MSAHATMAGLILIAPVGLLTAWSVALRRRPEAALHAYSFAAYWWTTSIIPLAYAVHIDWAHLVLPRITSLVVELLLTVLPTAVSLSLMALTLQGFERRAGQVVARYKVLGELLSRQVPLALVLFILAALTDLFPGAVDHLFAGPVQALLSLGVLCTVASWLYPGAMRIIGGGRPLADRQMERRLRDLAGQAGVQVRHIWVAHRVLSRPNAFVTGIVPGQRHVILTARLLQELEPDELEAVFAHELGHIRHGDLNWYLLSSLIMLAATFWLWQATLAWGTGETAVIFRVTLTAVINMVVFGALSRPFEYRADRFALQLTGRPQSLASALMKIVGKEQARPKQRVPALLILLQTHPLLYQRLEHIEKHVSGS